MLYYLWKEQCLERWDKKKSKNIKPKNINSVPKTHSYYVTHSIKNFSLSIQWINHLETNVNTAVGAKKRMSHAKRGHECNNKINLNKAKYFLKVKSIKWLNNLPRYVMNVLSPKPHHIWELVQTKHLRKPHLDQTTTDHGICLDECLKFSTMFVIQKAKKTGYIPWRISL